MRLDEYTSYDATGLAELLAKGEVSPAELGQCVVKAVAGVNWALNAVVELYPDALASLPSTALGGALHGIPTLTTDFPVEAGRPAEFGSRFARGFRARKDAVYWTRLRQGGLVNIGRTASSEFGLPAATETLLHGAARNPWNATRGVCGLSGGAAAAVAAGIVPLAQGSDGGGSIRNAASFCGLIGLKPSRGRVAGSPDGYTPLLGLGSAFMLTRSVRDTATLLDLCRGSDVGNGHAIVAPPTTYVEAMTWRPKALRIALCSRSWSGAPINAEVHAVVQAAAKQLAEFGHQVEEASPCFDHAAFLEAQKIIWGADAAADIPAIAEVMERPLDEDLLGSFIQAVYRYGRTLGTGQLVDAFAVYDRVTRQLDRFLGGFDLLLTPTAPIGPEPIGRGERTRHGRDVHAVFADLEAKETFTALFNATGQPAMSLPFGRTACGLPAGIQLVAPLGREDLLLAVARQIEEQRQGGPGIWGQGLPSIHASRQSENQAWPGRAKAKTPERPTVTTKESTLRLCYARR